MIHFFIPTFKRDDLLKRAVKSIRDNVGDNLIKDIIIINQNKASYGFKDSKIIEIYEKPAGKAIYKPGVEFIKDYIEPRDILIFLDDDIAINETFSKGFSKLKDKLLKTETGCIQLSFSRCKVRDDFYPIQYGYKGGGICVEASKYFDFGGHGEDYYDDIELFIRSYIRGYGNYRCRFINSQHDLNKKISGGIRGYFNDILHMKRCGYKYSKLKEKYRQYMLPANNFMGFKLKR
jgi:hypothetical protein